MGLKVEKFLLDAAAWVGSDTIRDMTGDQVKAYMYLLTKSWLQKNRAFLPADEAKLAILAEVSPQKWDEIKAVILAQFESDGCGHIYHENMMELDRELERKKMAGATGWTRARRRLQAHVARKNFTKVADEIAEKEAD